MKFRSGKIYFCVVTITLGLGLVGPEPAKAISIKLEESADPPGGVGGGNGDVGKEVESALAGGSKKQGPEGTGGEKDRYRGIFALLKPLSQVVPVKSANFKTNFIKLAKNQGGPGFLLNHSFGNYFLELGGKDVGPIKQLTGKTQYAREIKSAPVANGMNEVSAKILGADVKYARTHTKSVSGTGAATAINVQENRSWGITYQTKKGGAFAYSRTHNWTQAEGGAFSKNGTEQESINVAYPLTRKIKFTHQSGLNLSINNTSGDKTRATQTNTRFDFPLTKKLTGGLGFQTMGNESRPGNFTIGQITRKRAVSGNLSYALTEKIKLLYFAQRDNNRISAPNSFTKFGESKKNILLEGPLTGKVNFRLGMDTQINASSGKTGVKSGNLSFNHNSSRLFPGTTTLDTRRQYSHAGTSSSLETTRTLNTPLTYLKDKLKVNFQNTFTSQKNLVNQDVNDTSNKNYTVNYALSPRINLGLGYTSNRTLGNLGTGGISARQTTTVASQTATVNLPRLPWIKLGNLKAAQYTYGLFDNHSRTDVPTVTITNNQSPKHALSLAFAGKDWTGSYGLDRSRSFSNPGEAQRAYQHNISFQANNFKGFQVTMTYLGGFLKSSDQETGVFRLSKKKNEHQTYYLSQEFFQSNDKSAPNKASKNRYLEAGLEFTF